MKTGPIFCLAILSLLVGLLAGCASSDSRSAAADPATQKKGRWITLPPVTGSRIPRQVWVEDSGQTSASPSASNVRTGSAAALESIQRTSGNFK